VGAQYRSFPQIADEEVRELLAASHSLISESR
jgi:predicted phosphoribosyltransferase